MDRPVKILSLVPYKFLPPDMGGQKGIAFFNRYLCKHVELTCITIQDNKQHSPEPYPIQNSLSNSALRYIHPGYFFRLQRIIKQEKITHLLLEHPYYGWLGLLLKWACKIKLIVHSHNIESLRFKTLNKWWWGILWHYERLVHRHADHSFFIQETDRTYAIDNFKLDPQLCTVITYGFELSGPPSIDEKRSAKDFICTTHAIDNSATLLLFNGTLGYKPNLDALDIILEKINPILLANNNFDYKIIICGNKLPENYKGLASHKEKNIIYAGFVEDINVYFKGTDIFINPVIDGGGIKTKVVEALGNDLSVISTASGAIGIPAAITGGKLEIIRDNNWDVFTAHILTCDPAKHIPPSYFDHFYWDHIAAKAAAVLTK